MPTLDTDIETTCNSKTYRKTLPCGKLYICLNYKPDGKIDYIKTYSGKQDNDCGGSFCEAISDLLTFAIRRIRNEHEAKAIIKTLRYHKCNKIVANADHLTSCADAIGQVLEKELSGVSEK